MDSGTEPRRGLRFTVLGPVRAWHGDEPVPAGSPQQRALLAALLLRGGRTATAAELIDALWGEAPPVTALAALRSYASRLRKALGADTLTTVDGGYSLSTTPGGFDLAEAEVYAAEAEKAQASSDHSRARELLGAALALWSGEPLTGLPGPYAGAQRVRLSEWRLQLLETRLDLDLRAGCHAEAVSELTALSAEHPLRERLRALLMLALYRGGRQAEALGVYADTRRLLAEELGVDPGTELGELHQRVLEADEGLAAPPVTPGRPVAEPVRPAQLPAKVSDFTGRDALVTELGEQLRNAGSGVMVVSAVAGIGGVGKTTLAVHVAHAARETFPDGQLYVDLQGSDARPSEPEAVLASFLRALGTPESGIPDSLADRSALFRSTLSGRRVLTLLDNAHDAAQVRPLLPGTEGCAALVTSRVRMAGLPGAHLVDLDVMSPEEALQLFTKVVGEERATAERQAALDVVGACGFLPLAIRIAASRLASRRTWTVSLLARKLADERHRLRELRTGDLAVTSTFELGYGQLAPAQARAFRLLALADGPDIALDAAAAVLDLGPYEAEELLETLVDTSLLESAAPARYRFHDLLRLYARDCAERDETPESRESALSRLLDFYLASAGAVYALENPGDRVLDHFSPTTRTGPPFGSREDALDWLFSEAQSLLAAVGQSAARGCEGPARQAVDLLWAAQDLMESGVHARQYEQAARALATTAGTCGQPLVEGRVRVMLSQRESLAGKFDEANAQARRSLSLGLASGDSLTVSYSLLLIGINAFYGRRHDEAADYLGQALAAFRLAENLHGEAAVLSNLSRVHTELGNPTAAVGAAERGLSIYQSLGSGLRLANGLYSLAVALTNAGRPDEALVRLAQALAIFRERRQSLWVGMTLFRMSEGHLAEKHWRESVSHAEQALTFLRDVGGEWRMANTLTVLGIALDGIGHRDRARACWHDALRIFTSLGAPEAGRVQDLLGPHTMTNSFIG